MARIARVVVPDLPHHITQRGVRSMNIFFKPEDYEEYKTLLGEQAKKYQLKIVAYTLMTNHVHLIAIPKTKNSFRAIAETHRLYTRKINFEQATRGHLFQERFFSTPLDAAHFLSALRYVELNPIRAKITKTPYEYPYSSALKRLGVKKEDALLSAYEPTELIDDYEEFLNMREDELLDNIREKTRTGRPCGDSDFYDLIKSKTGRDLTPKAPGRKRKRGK